MLPLDWDDLRFVRAVVDEGSVRRAAVSLHVSHPTVARRIAGLEQTLGTTLFHRSQGRYRPTAQAQVLADTAREVGALVDRAHQRVLGRPEPQRP